MRLRNYLTLSNSAMLIHTPQPMPSLPPLILHAQAAKATGRRPTILSYPSVEGISSSSIEKLEPVAQLVFLISDTETIALPEAESQTSKHNSTSLAQVLQATVTQYTFTGFIPYPFYYFLRLRFQKEQNLF